MKQNQSIQIPNLYLSLNGKTEEGKIKSIVKPRELTATALIELMQAKGITNWNNKRFIGKCAWLLELIYRKQLMDYNYIEEGYVRLMSERLKKKLGKNKSQSPQYYKDVIRALEKIGLIEIKHTYTPSGLHKGKCKGYRLTLTCSNEIVEAEPLYTEELWSIDDNEHAEELKHIRMDENKFMLVQNLLSKSKGELGFWFYHLWCADFNYVKIADNKRIHSLLTQLPKEYRDCFRVGNEKIYEADIHACQPFLFLKVVQELASKQVGFNMTWKEIFTQFPDVHNYYSRISEGKFYEHLYCLFKGWKKKTPNKVELQPFKKKVLKEVFYSDTTDGVAKKLLCVFAEEYPTIMYWLFQIKSEYTHYKVAEILQLAESLVMNDAVDKLRSNGHCTWRLRFHDAVLCKAEEIDIVIDSIEEACKEHIGLVPRVKHGNWGKEIEEFTEVRNLAIRKTKRTIQYDSKANRQDHQVARKAFIDQPNTDVALDSYRRTKNALSKIRQSTIERKRRSMAIDRKILLPSEWTLAQRSAWNEYALSFINSIIDKFELTNASSYVSSLCEKERRYWQDKLQG